MKKTALLIAAGSYAAMAVPAMAQSDDRAFNGPWVAGMAGYDSTSAGSTVDNDSEAEDDESADGLLYGAALGYDIDMGSAVLGIEGEWSDSTAEVDVRDPADPEYFGLGRVEAGRDLYVGARAGIKVTPQTLVYGKAGYTNARYNVLGGPEGAELSENIDSDGFRVGAGVEQKLGSNAFARLEYRYSNYSEAEVDYEGELADSERFEVDTDRHQAVASVGWRF